MSLIFNILGNGHFILIWTSQYSANDDRKIHLFRLSLFFVLILGDNQKNMIFIICIFPSFHWRGTPRAL